MTHAEINLNVCPRCGHETCVQFEVDETYVYDYCIQCGLSTRSEPTRNFDPTPAAVLWNRRVEVKHG